MQIQLVELFFEIVSKSFQFLVDEHGFTPPLYEVDEKASLAKVRYFGKNLAIEFLLDRREFHVDCKIVRMINKEVATDYAVDKHGQLVRTSLSSLFRKRGVRERLFRNVGSLTFEERMRIMLDDYAQMIRKHGHDILADSPTVFSN